MMAMSTTIVVPTPRKSVWIKVQNTSKTDFRSPCWNTFSTFHVSFVSSVFRNTDFFSYSNFGEYNFEMKDLPIQQKDDSN